MASSASGLARNREPRPRSPAISPCQQIARLRSAWHGRHQARPVCHAAPTSGM